MATAQPVHLPIPEDFSAFEQSLVQKTELALLEGLELERWSRDPNRKIDLHRLNLDRPYKLENRAYGYFAHVHINGQTLSALGALQEVEFGKITGANPEQRLKDYVLRLFLNTANWVYPSGDPGGFTFKQMLYCTAEGKYGRYPDDQLNSVQDWNVIGPKYRWSLFTGYLHDFEIRFGPLHKTFKEAVAVVQHPDFIHIVENPRPGYKLEVAIGYPFIDYAPVPNYFGFGPGKFNWAVKTYSFLLRDNNTVRCNMDFVAGARPKKVLNFGALVPDPFYGTAAALKFFTLGLFPEQKVHDLLDLEMAALHSQVHQALMEGSAKVFAAWTKNNAL
ncbi:MAG TPA: hypothetical protein VH724_05805 [Candidatus Angelobacter sp.]|nr:hypothetical protein [Candidatus Angelobacter sp.]